MAVDVSIQIGLGRFFGAKFRSAVLYGIFEQTGDRGALAEALKAYRTARSAWAELANQAANIYQRDVTVGELPHLRGHWLDRLAAIDEDISDMAKKLEQSGPDASQGGRIQSCIQEALGRPRRISVECRHVPPASFRPGQPLNIEATLQKSAGSMRLYYRHVNQAERWQLMEMAAEGNRFRAIIPAAYTDSSYPLQYYFELRPKSGAASLYPGFASDLSNQPYFVVRQKVKPSRKL